jgi:hypothetical protein
MRSLVIFLLLTSQAFATNSLAFRHRAPHDGPDFPNNCFRCVTCPCVVEPLPMPDVRRVGEKRHAR